MLGLGSSGRIDKTEKAAARMKATVIEYAAERSNGSAYAMLASLPTQEQGRVLEELKEKGSAHIGLAREPRESYMLDATERDYLLLKERFRGDTKKLLELANDWFNYTEAIYELTTASEAMFATGADWDKLTSGPDIKRQEIERRFQQLLGQEYTDRAREYNKL
jgi:hypothetical protein